MIASLVVGYLKGTDIRKAIFLRYDSTKGMHEFIFCSIPTNGLSNEEDEDDHDESATQAFGRLHQTVCLKGTIKNKYL